LQCHQAARASSRRLTWGEWRAFSGR
jgi:hypothetical protein